MSISKKSIFTISLILLVLTLAAMPIQAKENEILDLDLSSLMQIQITSAGRKVQNLADVPAAVYVINQEDIQNSGATSIPEALRMAPGLQVARISSSKWAIASRGFNGTFSNKLLVQIDGRSVYSPAYSGVYWDVQNVILGDVERIEVIRGPGATLWGANAVNGVINIITKQTSDTQGGVVTAGSGNHEKKMVSLRYGTQLNENTYGRFYISHHERDEFQYLADKSDAHDDGDMTYGGFRLDGDIGLDNTWTVQGDLYSGEEKQQIDPYWTTDSMFSSRADDEIDTKGYNLLARWQHNFSTTNNWTLQAYYDYSDRDEIYVRQIHHTVDLDFQHRFQWWKRHDIVWGVGYRTIKDEFDNSYMVSFLPDSDRNDLLSGFFQDEINIFTDKLWLTLGGKLENNDYTGTELQPSARLLWKPAQNHSLWTSVSKAVRTPSRAENSSLVLMRKIPLPPTYTTDHTLYVHGNSEMDAEEVIAYEAGYRFSHDRRFSLDLALFYNKYKNLTDYATSWLIPNLLPGSLSFINGIKGNSKGLEASITYEPTSWLSTELTYSYIRLDLQSDIAGSAAADVAEDSSPRHQVALRTSVDLHKNLRLNLWCRYVDELKKASNVAAVGNIVVPAYLAVDANVIWKLQDNLEFMLVGQNLFDNAHLEFVNEYFTPAIEVESSIYANLKWKF